MNKKNTDSNYEVVIIGAGIGGLVCGCYLAKVGLKVLIVEQHDIPGGYCTSFNRNGYRFDVGVHYLGGIKRGILGRVLDELELRDQIKFNQFDPIDKIIMPDNTTYIRANSRNTIEEFKKSFPHEKNNIEEFFKFIMQKNFMNIYARVKKLSFKSFVDAFFDDYRLKATLGVLLGNIGTPLNKAAAFPAIVLFRQYVLDPGYYPKGGIQKLPDALVKSLKKNGGECVLSKKVIKIITEHEKIKGVVLDDGEKIFSDIVVSNADATMTFNELLEIKSEEKDNTAKMVASPSMFMVYLGLKGDLNSLIKEPCNIYYFNNYDIHKAYSDKKNPDFEVEWFVGSFPFAHDNILMSEKGTGSIIVFSPYKTMEYWKDNRGKLCDRIMSKVQSVIPGLENFIDLKFTATPLTFHRYTSNRRGAFAGWLSTLKQTKVSFMPQRSTIKGLYLTGHWCTMGYVPFGGIPSVAFSGRRAARCVLEDINKKWKYKDFYL